MLLKYRPDLKTVETEKISAILNANKEKMKKNLGNLLQSSNGKTTTRIKLRPNILKKADSFNKKDGSGSFFNLGNIVKDFKN